MAIRQKLLDTELEELPEDIDDLDAAYIKKLQDDGIDPSLVNQFMSFLQTASEEEENK